MQTLLFRPVRLFSVQLSSHDSVSERTNTLDKLVLSLKKAEEELGICTSSDWTRIQPSDIRKTTQPRLLDPFRGSLINFLKNAYPDQVWNPNDFKKVTRGYWMDQSRHVLFFDELARKLNITSWEEWYKVTNHDVKFHGGRALLRYYEGDSHIKALMSAYPHLPWDVRRFKTGYWREDRERLLTSHDRGWNNPQNRLEFTELLAKKLHFQNWQDWYRVSKDDFRRFGGAALLARYGNSIENLLVDLYPRHPWKFDPSYSHARDSNAQKHLFHQVAKFFPDQVLFNYIHQDIKFATTGIPIESDVFIPSVKLALEYQGRQHYEKTIFNELGAQKQAERDAEKQRLLHSNGITLVQVPYWWDRKQRSLVATICRKRPDLKQILAYSENGKPIRDRKELHKITRVLSGQI
eukprot:TRINITY_DN5168_c0_g2_i1.p1 TRINITY_DN5168_c0_g2~~TRINITY_DN5168_c0_g2_i1.p1  ORF type:complete len:407 (-),score=50.27 TRINITY_DN5168_c0_g2_i1:303-1523(-)